MKKILLILSVLCLFSCGSTTSENNQSSIEEGVQSTLENGATSEENETTTSETLEEKVLEVDLTNDKEAIDLATNSEESDKIKSLFGDLLIDMQCNKVFASDGGIKLASSKYDGSWILTFTNKISKIEVEAKSYTNYVDYSQSYYCDTPTFLVNDFDTNIVHYENALSEYSNYIIDVNDLGTNTIKFESKNGRTIMKALKIYYY